MILIHLYKSEMQNFLHYGLVIRFGLYHLVKLILEIIVFNLD